MVCSNVNTAYILHVLKCMKHVFLPQNDYVRDTTTTERFEFNIAREEWKVTVGGGYIFVFKYYRGLNS